MNRAPINGIRGSACVPAFDSKNRGEMKIKRELRTLAGVLLILMFASGAQAATVVFDKTDFRESRKTHSKTGKVS